METTLVSIIIPVHNVAPFLREAFDSVINQTFENLEIIIIDDGSNDGSELVCDEYADKDKRILIVHQDNAGLSAARNTGLKMARGEIIAFLDSDDAYSEFYISTMVEIMKKEMADIVICGFSSFYTDGKMDQNCFFEESVVLNYDRSAALRALADGSINPAVWNKVYSRKLLETVRFPVGHVHEDRDTMYKVFDHCEKVSLTTRKLYKYRRRTGSITDGCSQNNIDDWNLACNHFESYIKNNIPNVFSTSHLESVYRKHLSVLASYYIRFILQPENKANQMYSNQLRKQIIEIGHNARWEACERRVKVVFWLICNCPWLLKTAYPFYYSMTRMSRRIITKIHQT